MMTDTNASDIYIYIFTLKDTNWPFESSVKYKRSKHQLLCKKLRWIVLAEANVVELTLSLRQRIGREKWKLNRNTKTTALRIERQPRVLIRGICWWIEYTCQFINFLQYCLQISAPSTQYHYETNKHGNNVLMWYIYIYTKTEIKS